MNLTCGGNVKLHRNLLRLALRDAKGNTIRLKVKDLTLANRDKLGLFPNTTGLLGRSRSDVV